MNSSQPNTLARCLRDFFYEYLPGLRGMSPHTIHSYRDTLVLLLRFLATTKQLDPAKVDIEHLDAQTIIAFLTHLEEVRHNRTTTRNVRLAAIHAFFRYVAAHHPERLEQAQRVLGIPFKRTASKPIDYLDEAEIRALLESIDRATPGGCGFVISSSSDRITSAYVAKAVKSGTVRCGLRLPRFSRPCVRKEPWSQTRKQRFLSIGAVSHSRALGYVIFWPSTVSALSKPLHRWPLSGYTRIA
jgi:integrase